MTNLLKKLFKTGFFHIFGSSVINKVVSFLSSVVLVWLLSKSEYGIFSYAWNIYGIIILANGLGIESGVIQICSEKSNDIGYSSKICNWGLRIGNAFNLIVGLVIIVLGLLGPIKYERARWILVSLCVLPILQFCFGVFTAFLRSQKQNVLYAKISLLNTILVFIGSILGAFVLRERGLVLGYYLAYCISVIVMVKKVKLIDTKPSNIISEDKRALMNISVTAMFTNGLSQVLYLLDVFVLGIVASNEEVLASYKVATQIPAALSFIPLSLMVYLYPYFAEHINDGDWCIKAYRKVVTIMGAINLVISGIMTAFAPYIIRLIYSERYLDAVPVFRILAINYFISGTFRIISGNLLSTQRKLRFNMFVAIVAGLINAVADYYFIKNWGSVGAAIATVLVVLVSSIMTTTYLVYTFRRNSEKKRLAHIK